MPSSNFSSGGGALFAGNVATRDFHVHINDDSHTNTDDHKIPDWFCQLNFWTTYQDHLSRRHEGTGTWFLQEEKFVRWRRGKHKVLLGIGIPGSGKTVLSAIVVEHLLNHHEPDVSVAVTCIHLNYKDRITAVSLLSGVVKQFLQQLKTTPDLVRTVFKAHNTRRTWPELNEYLGILQSLSDQFSNTYLVIDALDECDRAESRNLLRILNKVSGLQLLIFTRNLSYVEHQFSAYIRIDIRADECDMKSYLDSRIREEAELSELIKEDPRLYEDIRTTIVDRSGGMFLLAHLHLEALSRCDTHSQVRSVLQKLPTELYATYEKAMERIERQSEQEIMRAKQVIFWISGALRPLRVEELRDALAVQIGTNNLNKGERPAASRLTSACAGLVTIDRRSQVIKLAHETIQKYLKDMRSDIFLDAQEVIAKTCLTYLSYDTFAIGRCTDDQTFVNLSERNRFIEYASKYWGRHVYEAGEEKLLKSAIVFLQDHPRIACAAQVMLVDDRSQPGFSGMVPRNASGLHLAAHFNLPEVLAALLKTQIDPDARDSNDQTPLSYAASSGSVAAVLYLMNYNGVSINSKDRFGRTPLSRASEEGHEAVVKSLLDHTVIHIDSRDRWGTTPLVWAASRGHVSVVELLAGKRANINARDYKGETALSKAVDNNYQTVVRLLLRMKARIHNSTSVLGWAIREGLMDIFQSLVEYLIENGAVLNQFVSQDMAPLRFAIECGEDKTVKLLLKLGGDINMRDSRGETLVHWAIQKDRSDLLSVLSRNGAAIDAKTRSGRSVLRFAIECGRYNMLSTLIRLGANINTPDDAGNTVLHWATDNRQGQVIRLLHDLRASMEAKNHRGSTALELAVRNDDEATVRLLTSLGADIEARNTASSNETAFHWAAKSGKVAMLRVLADLGADLNVKDGSGSTAIRSAILSNQREAVNTLVNLGVQFDEQYSADRTLLHEAANRGYDEVVENLIHRGADLNKADKSGKYAATCAIESEYLRTADLLLQADAYPGTEGALRDFLASQAVYDGNYSALDLLFKGNMIVEVEERGEEYHIHYTSSAGKPETVKRANYTSIHHVIVHPGTNVAIPHRVRLHNIERVLQKICDKKSPSWADDWTAMHFALREGRLDAIKLLLNEDSLEAKRSSKSGRTPLHIAAQYGHTEIVQFLLHIRGVDKLAQTPGGWTVLHLAARNGHFGVVDLLVRQDLLLKISMTSSGITPLHFAAQMGHVEVVERLLQGILLQHRDHPATMKWSDVERAADIAHRNGYEALAASIRTASRLTSDL